MPCSYTGRDAGQVGQPITTLYCCEVNYCQYLSSTVCLISVFQHGILTCESTFDNCITVWSTYGITCEGNRHIVVVLEINNSFIACTANGCQGTACTHVKYHFMAEN